MAQAVTDQQQLQTNAAAFNQTVAAARAMVQRLTTSSGVTMAQSIAEIAAFQKSFTQNRAVVFDELQNMTQGQFRPAAVTLELRNKGLTADGKYGARTGTALLLTMWARSGDAGKLEAFGNAVPANVTQFPQYYMENKGLYDDNLAPFNGDAVTPSPIPSIPDPTPAPVTLPPQVSTPPQDAQDFGNDGSTVIGQGQGRMSFATMLAILAGVSVVGGFSWYALKKNGKLPRFLKAR